MATTSPDNLYSPDATAAYNIPVDTAAMQSSVQAALNNFAGRKGTTAQRTAYLSLAAVGEFFVDTSDSTLYQKVGSSWVSQDTGWIAVTSFSNSFSASTSEGVAYRRLFGVTYLRGDLKRNAAPASLTAFQLPTGFRPSRVVRMAGRPDLSMSLIVDTAGNVIISATSAQPAGSGSGYALAGFSFPAEG